MTLESFIVLKRVLLVAGALLVLWLAYELIAFPDVDRLKTEPPETTAFMERRKAELRRAGKDDSLRYRWVSYERIAPTLRRAVLVSEDSQFYEHEGVDVEAMREALKRDWKQRKITHGGSTITQQLAKNLYLSPSRNPIRKIREYFIARSLERNLSKKRILELYLNVVEFGERVYGAEAAARHYFDRSAAALTADQAALLAGSLPNPRVMNPAKPNARLRARRKIILSRMRRWGYAAEKEVLAAKEPAAETTTTELAPEITEEVEAEAETEVPADATTATVEPQAEPETPLPSPSTATTSSEPESAPPEATSPPTATATQPPL